MKAKVLALALLLLLSARPAAAQFAVIDPANLAQSIIIAQRTLAEYEQRVQEYLTLYRMATGLKNMVQYRVRAIVPGRHDLSRFSYGSPLLDALNDGDPLGEKYASVVRPMEALHLRLPADVRRTLNAPFAAIEIADSVSQRAIHQTAMIRGSSDQIAMAIGRLDADVTSPADAYHAMTVNLDKISGAALIGRRQESASNQLLSHVIEQQLVETKRNRDSEASTLNMHINGMQHGAEAQRAIVAGTADALRAWRQP